MLSTTAVGAEGLESAFRGRPRDHYVTVLGWDPDGTEAEVIWER